MIENCADHGATFSHRLGRCKGRSTTCISFQFMEAARRHEEFNLGSQAANKRSSRKLEDMLVFHVVPDNVISELFTDGATKHQLDNAGLQAAERNSKKNLFTFLAKFQKRIASTRASDQASPWRVSFHASLRYRGVLVRECIELARRISRTAAVCFSPSSDAANEDDDLPYMQLDKVTHALTRDAFGPLYLVT